MFRDRSFTREGRGCCEFVSHQATTWVMEFSQSRLADRLVLGAIAHRISNDSGEAWPSIATIAREANLSERSVHYSIRALSAMGELEISQGKTRMGTNTYRMPRFLAWVQSLHPCGRVQSAHRGVQSTTKGVQGTAAKASQFAPEPSLEPSVNHQRNRTRTQAPRALPSADEHRNRIENRNQRLVRELNVAKEIACGGPIDVPRSFRSLRPDLISEIAQLAKRRSM
jgi:hypothetical protein